MSNVISIETISDVVEKTIQKDIVSSNDNSLIFFDIDFLKERILKLKNLFLNNALHALAIKTNPLPRI